MRKPLGKPSGMRYLVFFGCFAITVVAISNNSQAIIEALKILASIVR